jgi:glycine cleavage system aminomethyltransferase T
MGGEPFRFPGPGGLTWTHRVETLGVEQTIAHAARYAKEPGFINHIRKQAAVLVAHKILETASAYREREDGLGGVRYEWQFSVVMPDDNRNWFAEQIDRERRTAREAAFIEAADALVSAAAQYRTLAIEGPCAHVIASELGRQAQAMRERATRPEDKQEGE